MDVGPEKRKQVLDLSYALADWNKEGRKGGGGGAEYSKRAFSHHPQRQRELALHLTPLDD